MEALQPLADGGPWDSLQAHTGIALLVQGVYEAQGYPFAEQSMLGVLNNLMPLMQQHMLWVDVGGGRRMQGDEQIADFTLRVSFNCLTTLFVVGLDMTRQDAQTVELLDQAYVWATHALNKLGGPLLTGSNLPPADVAALRTLEEAEPSELEHLAPRAPAHVLAIYLLQAMYDIDIRVVKWVLHYVALRCAKEAFARVRDTDAPISERRAKAAAWQDHCRALVLLAPDSPYGAFLAAEARWSPEGANPGTLAAMRAAAAAAQAKGDDLLAWLAHLSVAQNLVYGGAGGDTFLQDEVFQALDAAEDQQASAKRWGGDIVLEPRCRAVKAEVKMLLRQAREAKREQREKQRETQQQEAQARPGCAQRAGKGGGRGGGSGGGRRKEAEAASEEGTKQEAQEEDDGRLPCAKASGITCLPPVALAARKCEGCQHFFHKTMSCSRCRSAWYCGRECQTAHWKAGHKAECAAMAAARTAAKGDAKREDDE